MHQHWIGKFHPQNQNFALDMRLFWPTCGISYCTPMHMKDSVTSYVLFTSWMAVMTTCCTDSSMAIILWIYSCFSLQFTAQPSISCNNRPSSVALICSPVKRWERHLLKLLHCKLFKIKIIKIPTALFLPHCLSAILKGKFW